MIKTISLRVKIIKKENILMVIMIIQILIITNNDNINNIYSKICTVGKRE